MSLATYGSGPSCCRSEHGGVAFPGSQDLRFFASEIDHGGHLDSAGARVQHQIDLMLEPLSNFLSIIERDIAIGQQQSRG